MRRCWLGIIGFGMAVLAAALQIPLATAHAGKEADQAPAPVIVATIKPIQGLVAAVMDGVGTPGVLIPGGNNPHTYALKPSQAKLLEKARLVFWVGPTLEASLARPLHILKRARLVTLIDSPGLHPLPFRTFEGHEVDETTDTSLTVAGAPAIDPHIWLDPENAKAMVRTIAKALSEADPAHRERYESNAAGYLDRLAALDTDVATQLRPVAGRPFVTYHDAFHYLERRYGLRNVGSVTLEPDRPPGARWIREIRQRIHDDGVMCVFVEPQFSPTLAATVVEGSNAKIATLDALGTGIPSGPSFYGILMRSLAQNLRTCLSGPSTPSSAP